MQIQLAKPNSKVRMLDRDGRKGRVLENTATLSIVLPFPDRDDPEPRARACRPENLETA